MLGLLSKINAIFDFLGPVTDAAWDFPTNYTWYSSIPILGEFSLAIVMLLGSGIFFTFWLGGVQVKYFRKSFAILKEKNKTNVGLSPMAAFLLSSATRIGPGNIMGVTGAVSTGGPGALFWMWVSAFFGMAISFVEATLSQIFKEKDGDNYVGGIAYYGRRLLGNSKVAGISIAIAYIIYALFTLPGQVFHMFTAFGGAISQVTGKSYERLDSVYIVIGVLIVISVIPIIFGGIKRVAKVTDIVVPVMAVVYFLIALLLILVNIDKVPYFFSAVFSNAFTPDAIFGGAFGVALQQGIKRGLMSNEAGQGTITMAAAASNAKHPVEQGFVQSFGVFIDTFVICTVSGYLVIIAQTWNQVGIDFNVLKVSRLNTFTTSLGILAPSSIAEPIQIIMTLCYGLFAFSTIIGMIAFIEVCSKEVSKGKGVSIFFKVISSLIFVPFGVLCVWTGLELDNIWVISDLANLMMVVINIPLILLGRKYVKLALEHYKKDDKTKFSSSVVGIDINFEKE